MDDLKLQGEVPNEYNKSKDSILPQTVTTTTTSICQHPKYPLLNSIPSDMWSNRPVLIGTGPLVNHVGRVTKWGNGWVTVSTTTTGNNSADNNTSVNTGAEILHNRRAIELFLLPDSDTAAPDILKLNSQTIGALLSENQLNTDVKDDIIKSNCSFNNIKMEDVLSYQKIETRKQEKTLKEEVTISSKPSIHSTKITKKIVQEDLEKLKEKNNSEAINSENMEVEDTTLTGQKLNKSLEGHDNNCTNHGEIDNVKKIEDHNSIDNSLEDVEITIKKVVTETSNTIVSTPLLEKHLPEVQGEEIGNTGIKPADVKKLNVVDKQDHLSSSRDTEDDEKIKFLTDVSSTPETNQRNEITKTPNGQKLTLMEELILAQTGRRVKNVDLALYSGGGRTIKKPKKYEDKTLIKKKRNKQQSDNEQIMKPYRQSAKR